MMKHIELVGPPGSGKSTIHAELVRRGHLGVSYGSITTAMIRELTSQKPLLEKVPDMLLKKYVNQVLEPKRRNIAFEQFTANNPEFLSVLHTAMDLSVPSERVTVLKSIKHAAERLQIGISATSDSTLLIVDEGLVQKYMGAVWRCSDQKIQSNSYFQAVPTPDLLIYVTAPVGLCIDRQSDRGRITASKSYWTKNDIRKEQEELHSICMNICDHLQSRTNVITVDTTKEISEVINNISNCEVLI